MLDDERTTDGRLNRIARALGIPVERLYDPPTPTPPPYAAACLELWSKLHTDADRIAVLDYMARMVDATDP